VQWALPGADNSGTMIGERTLEGWEVRLRPRGAGRAFSALFLSVWLCGWAVGETLALWILVRGAIATFATPSAAAHGSPPAAGAGVFLIVWVTFWTIGGIAAMRQLMRLVWAADRLRVAAGRLSLTRSLGPFRSTRTFGRESIRRVVLAKDGSSLSIDTTSGSVQLSRLGTPEEREEVAIALRSELALTEPEPGAAVATALPDGWEDLVTPEGERVLVADRVTRAARARLVGVLTLIAVGGAALLVRPAMTDHGLIPIAAIVGIVAVNFAWGAWTMFRGRDEWRIGGERLVLRRRFGASVRDRFEARRLELTASKDSDGDPWYSLDAVALPEPSASGVPPATFKSRRTIVSTQQDDTVPRQLGAWLASASGVEFEDRSTDDARAETLEALKGQLAGSGPLGKLALRFVARAEIRKL
jgi:hypothetical protein